MTCCKQITAYNTNSAVPYMYLGRQPHTPYPTVSVSLSNGYPWYSSMHAYKVLLLKMLHYVTVLVCVTAHHVAIHKHISYT